MNKWEKLYGHESNTAETLPLCGRTLTRAGGTIIGTFGWRDYVNKDEQARKGQVARVMEIGGYEYFLCLGSESESQSP